MKTLPRLIISGAALLLASVAQAQVTVYTAVLTGAAEATPNASPATGTATVTVDIGLSTMRVEATFNDLLGTVTAAHIHGATAVAGTGTAGVITTTPTFTSFPSGVTGGSYDHTFDMTLSGSYNSAFITANGGTVPSAFSAFVTALDAGKTYLNIHTNVFPAGEIRGFLTPVPEPASYASFLGLAALGAVALRRRRC
jgi:hypothetical protein